MKSDVSYEITRTQSVERRKEDPTPELTTYGNIKLGWIQGVLIPCLLNIWGVMLFLRIAWILAQAGIALTILIICMAGVVCIITTLSMSAICTNGKLQGGGVYFLVSRSLGAELGASVGIIFACANAIAASMNTIGFCESLNSLLQSHSLKIIDNGPNDIRIVGTIALLLMCIICAIGMDWETKTQNILIVIIIVGISNFLIGALVGPTSDRDRARGFVGLNIGVAKSNWPPDFRYSEGENHNIFSVFAIYFPAVTGVQAGANICGDLRDPATAIPKGTLIALAVSITSYLAMAVFSGTCALRDASGNITDIASGTLQNCKPKCPYGLHNNYEIMQMMSLWGPLIYTGCWAATLSTALTNLLSVPRLIQALGFDGLYPGLIFFSKRYGKHGEPYRGYVLTFLVSMSFLLIADLNTIAPLITNFYLASYALINFCTFHAAFVKPISWRPSFRFYNTWLSLVGFTLCIGIMVLISWAMALVTTFIFIALYLLVLYRKPQTETSWGSSTEAQNYREMISTIVSMYHRTIHIKLFNPQLLVLAGEPNERPWLVDMGNIITNVGSFMIIADITDTQLTQIERFNKRLECVEYLKIKNMRAFYLRLQGFNFVQGVEALLQSAGLGSVAPNVMLLGYKYDWATALHSGLLAYYHTIRLSFEFELGLAIYHVPKNMRPYKKAMSSISAPSPTGTLTLYDEQSFAPALSRMQIVMGSDSDSDYNQFKRTTSARSYDVSMRSQSQRIHTPPRKVGPYKPLSFSPSSILDAWWLYDDGGLNILLPYIIASRGGKQKISLRIFALPQEKNAPIEKAQAHVASVLEKLRIDYSQLTIITNINDAPEEDTWIFFNNLTKLHRSDANDETLISQEEVEKLYKKTCKHLRLRELLIENSFGSDFIVMSLPIPRKGISAALYMAWLEVMCEDMPPILFVRGNSTVVIE